MPMYKGVINRTRALTFNAFNAVRDDLQFLGSTTPLHAYYVGCLGVGNLGDDALYWAICELFEERVTLRTTGATTPLVWARRATARDTHVMLGGGTLVKKGRSPYLGRIEDWRSAHPAARFVVFGSGVGDAEMWRKFGVKTDIASWRAALEQADYIGVRGPLSRKHLQEWGVTREVAIIGDPAMWFARPEIRSKTMNKRIGLNFGGAGGQIHGQNEAAVLDFAARFMQALVQRGWQITLFPVTKSDVAYMQAAVRQAGLSNVAMHTAMLDLGRTLDALEQQDVFVGEKLHSVIFASCTYTPSVMIEYRTKCRDFMASIDREQWTFRTDRLDVDETLAAVDSLYNNIEWHQADLQRHLNYYRTQLVAAADHVVALFTPGRSYG
jgi:hypothetical protein